MNSPDNIPYKTYVAIDRQLSVPIYLQIANQLIGAIAKGWLPAGIRLPGSRRLSALLEVHRNTITAAYDELYAQGWIEIFANRGAFVASILPQMSTKDSSKIPYVQRSGFEFNRSILLDNPFERTSCTYILNDGSPDIRLTQIEDFSKIYSANMKRKSNRSKMDYYNQEGSEYFKEQLAAYLQSSRGLQIGTGNLLITRSIEMSLFIISEILLQPGDIVAVGELSYFSANMIFQKSGSTICTLPVQDDGIDIDALEQLCETQKVRMIYVSAQHHYPTTVSLSVHKRMKLLQLARHYGMIIVEEDHDYDFQYDNKPLLPLASNDQHGMVIYVGSFGKSLAPGFRAGFVVAPQDLMVEMRKYLGIIDRQGDVLMEHALGEMIEEGAIHRHLKKSLKVYRERRDHMAFLLSSELGHLVDFEIPTGGLAYWVKWKNRTNLLKLSQQAQKNNLFIPRTLLYEHKHVNAMRIGFGNLDMQEMTLAIITLKRSVQEIQEHSSD